MKIINIEESKLKQIIKEESERINKIKKLKSDRENIKKQLNEMYEGMGCGDESVEEGLLKTMSDIGHTFIGKLRTDELMNILQSGKLPGSQMLYKQYNDMASDPEKQKLFIEFLKSNFDAASKTGLAWDEVNRRFTLRKGVNYSAGSSVR